MVGLVGAASYTNFFSLETRILIKAGIAIISLISWLLLKRNQDNYLYSKLAVAIFSVSLGVLFAHYLGNIPLELLGLSVSTVEGVAVAKLGEALPIITTILVIQLATGDKLEDLFLSGGNLRLTLTAGLIGFLAFAGLSYVQAIGTGLSMTLIGSALPWILIFIFANAFMEELWFRGLFLKKLEPLTGTRTSFVLTSLVFASVHITSTYVVDILVFVAQLMVLGLLWAWLMWRTKSIWGAVLIHAGADILVIHGFLSGANL